MRYEVRGKRVKVQVVRTCNSYSVVYYLDTSYLIPRTSYLVET